MPLSTGSIKWLTDPGPEAPVIGQVAIADDGSAAVASSRYQSGSSGYCPRYTVAKLRGQSGLGFFIACGDEADNDGDGAIDFDGGASENLPWPPRQRQRASSRPSPKTDSLRITATYRGAVRGGARVLR